MVILDYSKGLGLAFTLVVYLETLPPLETPAAISFAVRLPVCLYETRSPRFGEGDSSGALEAVDGESVGALGAIVGDSVGVSARIPHAPKSGTIAKASSADNRFLGVLLILTKWSVLVGFPL